ncbi:hypothetical protein ACWGHM_11605 [Streptomyces sp. NPDC054904]|uniref:hypothetical protein n=1 Tax=unclassified Streptomyces TaxID=2593676 RepID=UPI002481DA4B|nr:hypothetical protein [Streptomyces sp. Isolate_45]MDA5280499.1 hypothetical protein [Streptomyces sp. Isolate_45]
MKLRNTVAATLGALTLVLSLPGSALAATGEFSYKYVTDLGHEERITLNDPHSGKCINLFAVGDDEVPPGYGPHNRTNTPVTVYSGALCTGREWRLRANGSPATDQLEVRSVRFDAPAA